MITNTRFSALFVVLFVLASSFAAAFRLDGNNWPVVVVPADSIVQLGDSTSVAIQMNQPGTSATTVYLTSSHPGLIPVPASVTIPAGNSTAYIYIDVPLFPSQGVRTKTSQRNLATTVRITATANGRSAYTDISVQ